MEGKGKDLNIYASAFCGNDIYMVYSSIHQLILIRIPNLIIVTLHCIQVLFEQQLQQQQQQKTQQANKNKRTKTTTKPQDQRINQSANK